MQGPPEPLLPFLQALLHAPSLGLAFYDPALRHVWVGAPFAAMAHASAAALPGRTLEEALPSLAPALGPLLARALASGPTPDLTLSLTVPGHPGGAARRWRVTVLPAPDGAGVALVARDVTERRRAEDALRESEARFRGLVDATFDGIAFHAGGVILEVNRAFAALYGRPPEALVGRPVESFIAPESHGTVREALESGRTGPYEVVCFRASGERLHVEVLGRDVTLDGRPVRMTALRDISARKAAEEAERRTAHFREQLLGMVGHDLRSPLYAIQLGAAALLRSGALDELQARHAQRMQEAAERMGAMLRELLDFTRARLAGGLPVSPAPLALDRVVDRAVDEAQLAHPGRAVQRRYAGALAGEWDETRLLQLVANLLGNALQHSPPDSPVRVEVEGLGEEGVRLAVHNDGAPLGEAEREALFEPFRRGKRARGEGLGLGLFIARQIALAHGGRIEVDSADGRGTTFSVWLPRRAGPSPGSGA